MGMQSLQFWDAYLFPERLGRRALPNLPKGTWSVLAEALALVRV